MNYIDNNKKLLNKIFNMSKLNKTDENGNTYLHHLVSCGEKEFVNDFIKVCEKKDLKNDIINKPNKYNETPLFMAVKNNNQDIAQLLYENGANPNIVNKDGLNVAYEDKEQKGGSVKKIIYGERII